jgi:APA family basic amino acid/polyamine antiporter
VKKKRLQERSGRCYINTLIKTMAELKRTLGLGQCIFFGVGSILGAGIYTIVGKVAGWSGNMIWLSFILASVTALFTVFSYAELSAAFPRTGGEYEYAKKAFGKKMGIILGFIISLNGIISGATVSVGFAGYFTELIPLSTVLAAIGIIVIIFLINISGIRQSSTINVIFTIIEAGGLAFVIISAAGSIGKVDYMEMPERGMNGFFTGAALAFYAFIGFEEIVKLAEETEQPQKNIPRALFISCVIVMLVYTAVTLSAISALPSKQLAASESPLAEIVSNSYGRTGAIIISVIALFSTSNTVLSNMLGSSRVLLNISRETSALKKLAFVSPKRKTPVLALLLILVVMSAFALIGKIETIAMIANLFIFTTFLLVNLAVITLRVKDKNLKRPFRIPGEINDIPILPILGIVFTLLLLSYNIYGLIKGNLEGS